MLGAALRTRDAAARIVAEFPPASRTPVYAAKLGLSFQRFSGDRLAWQVAVDGDADRQSPGDASRATTAWRGPRSSSPSPGRVARGGLHLRRAVLPGAGRRVLRAAGGPGPTRCPDASSHLSGILAAGRGELALSARHADVHVFDEGRPRSRWPTRSTTSRRRAATRRSLAWPPACGSRSSARDVAVRGAGADAASRAAAVTATATPATGRLVGGRSTTIAAPVCGYIELGVTTFVLDGFDPVADAYRARRVPAAAAHAHDLASQLRSEGART